MHLRDTIATFSRRCLFLSDLFTVCDKAVSVRFKVITRIIHAHLGYRSAHRIEDDRIEFIVSHNQYCISIINSAMTGMSFPT